MYSVRALHTMTSKQGVWNLFIRSDMQSLSDFRKRSFTKSFTQDVATHFLLPVILKRKHIYKVHKYSKENWSIPGVSSAKLHITYLYVLVESIVELVVWSDNRCDRFLCHDTHWHDDVRAIEVSLKIKKRNILREKALCWSTCFI